MDSTVSVEFSNRSLFTVRMKTEHINEFFGKKIFDIGMYGTEWAGIAQSV